MKWKRVQRDGGLRDERAAGGGLGGGGLGGLPMGKLSIPALLVVVVVVLLGGGNLLNGGGGGGFDINTPVGQMPQAQNTGGPQGPDPEKNQVDFVNFLRVDVQDFWRQEFQAAGKSYRDADVTLYRQGVNTGCGAASSAVGPFYCPADQTVYLDLGFFSELSRRFGAPGDFAQAYVVAHELGHHVQNLLGIERQVREEQQQDPSKQNELSVRLELQADCFAGVWGHSVQQRGMLERGDLEEALTAASAVGDDRIQASAGARVNPETWTHGSADERMRWFRAGFDSGDPSACDTFSASSL
jgi:uncharacterized protein